MGHTLSAYFATCYLDTTLVTVSRLRRGLVPFASPGKDHTAHRLVALGMSQRGAVGVLYGLGVLGGVLAWIVALVGPPAGIPIVAFGVVSTAVALIWLERAPYERQEVETGHL